MRTRTIQTLTLVACLTGVTVLAAGCGAPPAEPEQAGPDQEFPSGVSGTGMNMDALPQRFGYGRDATQAEIIALNISVGPDGAGLPAGQGSVGHGRGLYTSRCAACHGANGQGVPGVGDRLVGREPIDSTGWNRTIGNYWPFAPTVFDYIRRAMPFDRPGSLSDDEVYALTAYLLHLNDIVPADAVMDANTLPRVVMPARDRFVPDDRLATTEVR